MDPGDYPSDEEEGSNDGERRRRLKRELESAVFGSDDGFSEDGQMSDEEDNSSDEEDNWIGREDESSDEENKWSD